ncbi:hypothetical protein PGT21_002191 [Puccinia graminis f. sp. tritici]|uniref:Uncharacterized protein n=1 Tax=Puccinia graminis f. sp. tritici TaxID=56615 RepID=A0A5B0MVT7_PUCGR|nr:hypothetical protein PGT21_002191 [Puccinia graminis f. sp. tritici]KAA1079950.1 hypothetical protein PGTUg99_011988 [Puccinia graminis f. sp. tritici]
MLGTAVLHYRIRRQSSIFDLNPQSSISQTARHSPLQPTLQLPLPTSYLCTIDVILIV